MLSLLQIYDSNLIIPETKFLHNTISMSIAFLLEIHLLNEDLSYIKKAAYRSKVCTLSGQSFGWIVSLQFTDPQYQFR